MSPATTCHRWRWLAALLFLVCVGEGVRCQQPNSAEASLLINGVDYGDYPINVPTAVPSFVSFEVTGLAGEVFLLYAGELAHGGTSFGAAGVFDLVSNAGLTLLLNGFQPTTPFDLTAVVGPSGTTSSAFLMAAQDLDMSFQGVVSDPTNPLGVRITAASRLQTFAGTVTDVTFNNEDDATFVPFVSGNVNVNGVMPNGVHVGSNGYVTFGTADSSDTPTASAMSSGPQRIALGWRDLDPTAGGRVTVAESPAGEVCIEYFRVPIMAAVPGTHEAETFDGTITIDDEGNVDCVVTSTAPGVQLTGFSPGGAAMASSSRNLSAEASFSTVGNEAAFEIFSQDRPFDLMGVEFGWDGPHGGGYFFSTAAIPLTVNLMLPPSGPILGLASLYVRGTGFDASTQVLLGGNPALTVDILNGDELVIRTPSGSLGVVDVEVVGAGGASVLLPGAYTYTAGTPFVAAGGMTPGQSIQVPFFTGFIFPFFDEWHMSMFVNANGTITFGAPDATMQPGVAAFESGPAKIAVAWGDWQWGPASQAAVHCTPFFCTVAFVDIEPTGGGTPFSAQIILSHHGEIFYDFQLPPPSVMDVFIGISPGGGLSTGAGLTDLSTFTGSTQPFDSAYECFDSQNPFDMTGLFLDVLPTQVVSPFFSFLLHP